MYSFTEYQGQSSLDKNGTLELNTSYVTSQKPLWLVLLKLVVLLGMVAVGTAIITPMLMEWLPLWKAALVTIGVLQVYIGIAFFVRPRYNSDNMGWFGGMANDPFQYSDNVNRILFQLHMLLGPGRFAAETMLDACALIGLAQGPEVVQASEQAEVMIYPSAYSQAAGSTEDLFQTGHRQPAYSQTTQGSGVRAEAAAPRADRFESSQR